jgi:hypothetical protein
VKGCGEMNDIKKSTMPEEPPYIQPMSDFDITRLCAEAKGYSPTGTYDYAGLFVRDEKTGMHLLYGPLVNDAQAMELDEIILKKYGFQQTSDSVTVFTREEGTFWADWVMPMTAENRRRWRCECVAKSYREDTYHG